MTPKTKKIILIALPLMLGTGFLIWYLTRKKSTGAYIPEIAPEKAKVKPKSEPKPAEIKASNAYPLKNGVYNSALVAQLQKILNSKGAKLVVDGDFGAKTEAALLKYYGKKQIDSATDLNAFKAQVQTPQLVNTQISKAQVVINEYTKSQFSQVYCTMDTQAEVVIPDGNYYRMQQQTIKFSKLQSFDHERFIPLGVAPTGELVVKYLSAWLGGETYTIFVDPDALAVKFL